MPGHLYPRREAHQRQGPQRQHAQTRHQGTLAPILDPFASSIATHPPSQRTFRVSSLPRFFQGAIEGVIAALQKYPQDVNVQRAGAMAVASLARLEPNRDKLGSLGAAELVLNGFKTHPNQVPTAPATAIELRLIVPLSYSTYPSP